MKLIPCPLNGPRNASEFICAGPAASPPPTETDDPAWSAYLFQEDNVRGVVLEWWCHVPTCYWFLVERDTATDEILGSFAPEDRPEVRR